MTEGTTASKGVGHHHKDLHFDQVVVKIKYLLQTNRLSMRSVIFN